MYPTDMSPYLANYLRIPVLRVYMSARIPRSRYWYLRMRLEHVQLLRGDYVHARLVKQRLPRYKWNWVVDLPQRPVELKYLSVLRRSCGDNNFTFVFEISE